MAQAGLEVENKRKDEKATSGKTKIPKEKQIETGIDSDGTTSTS